MLDKINPVSFIPVPPLFALHFASGIANKPGLAVILDCIPGMCYYFLLHRWFFLQGYGHGDYLFGDEKMKWENLREVHSTFQSIYLKILEINLLPSWKSFPNWLRMAEILRMWGFRTQVLIKIDYFDMGYIKIRRYFSTRN